MASSTPQAARGDVPSGAFLVAVAHVAASMRSGARPADAWWNGMGVRTDGGIPHLADLAQRSSGDPAAAHAVHVAARCAAEIGAPTATMLDRVVASLVRDAEAGAQREAALAGPRATARLLAWLPAVGVLLGFALGADPVAVLLDGRAGTGLLGLGAALTAVGQAWTRRHLRAAAAAGHER